MYSFNFTRFRLLSQTEVCREPCLLKHLRELAGGLEKRELPLLTGELGIQERHPFVVFFEASLLDVAQRGAAFVQFRLQNLKRLLGELQIEAGHFMGGVEFANIARFLQHVGADFLALVPEDEFRFAQLALGQFYVGEGLRTEDWNVRVDSNGHVVALKVIEELEVVVELAEHLVEADGADRGPELALGAFQQVYPGVALLFRFGNKRARLKCVGNQVSLLLIHRERRLLGLHLDRLIGYAREILKLLGENRITPFQMNDALANPRKGQLAASDFNRQFLAGLGTFASDSGNLFGAGALTTKQFEGGSNLRKFQVGGCCPHDDGVARAIEFDLLAFGAIFGRVQLPA